MVTSCSRGARPERLLGIAALVWPMIWPIGALAHVTLDTPNGGESLSAGSTFEIRWEIVFQHNTIDWDLWYSTGSNNGPWTEIAVDLPPGDPSPGTFHTFDWTIPNDPDGTAWVRVRQDNGGMDYFDVSDASFVLVAGLAGDFTGDGVVDGADLNAWERGFGATSAVTPGDGDADGDGRVTGADLLAWQRDVNSAVATSALQAVPEPATPVLVLIALFGIWRWPVR